MLDVQGKSTKEINTLMETSKELRLSGILGQRYLGNAFHQGSYELYGYAGNGFGSFLSGATLHLYGNAQEAVADTMSAGLLCIHGTCGDALAYGMRGGRVFIQHDCGARCGVHMKEYQEKTLLVIGGTAKNFLGEYLSGGVILVLNKDLKPNPVGRYCGVGAHGGAIYVRMKEALTGWSEVTQTQQLEIEQYIEQYCSIMKIDAQQFQEGNFYQKQMPTSNPYEGCYVDY